MKPEIKPLQARLDRLQEEARADLSEKQREIWARRAFSGELNSGATLRLLANAITDGAESLVRQVAPNVRELHAAQQLQGWDALKVAIIQYSLWGQAMPQVEAVADQPSARRAFRDLVSRKVRKITGKVDDAKNGFEVTF